MFNNILVLCVGNICRSPVAEALLAARSPHEVGVRSAGIGALVGMPADPQMRFLMQEKSFDVSEHRARQVTNDMLHQAELILVMETSHIDALPAEVRGRAKLLGAWSGGEIADPYRKSPEFFAEVFLNIERGVDAWSRKLWK